MTFAVTVWMSKPYDDTHEIHRHNINAAANSIGNCAAFLLLKNTYNLLNLGIALRSAYSNAKAQLKLRFHGCNRKQKYMQTCMQWKFKLLVNSSKQSRLKNKHKKRQIHLLAGWPILCACLRDKIRTYKWVHTYLSKQTILSASTFCRKRLRGRFKKWAERVDLWTF